MAEPETEFERARELLPWYLNGTLDAPRRLLVEAQLARSTSLREELEWLRKLDHDLEGTLPIPEGDLGLGRLMNRIEAQGEGTLVPLKRPQRRRWLVPSLALAATLVIAQTLVIGVLLNDRSQVLKPLGVSTTTQGSLLQVQFRSTATEAQMQELLVACGAEVVGGPGSLGIYTLRVAPERADEALRQLRAATAIVEAANPVPR